MTTIRTHNGKNTASAANTIFEINEIVPIHLNRMLNKHSQEIAFHAQQLKKRRKWAVAWTYP